MLDVVRRYASSWGVKILYLLIAVSFFIGFGILSSARSCFYGGGGVVAVVDGEVISVRDFTRAFYRYIEQLQKKKGSELSKEEVEDLKMRVVNVLVNRNLLKHYAMKLGITVSDDELANFIARTFNFFDAQGRFDRRRYLLVLRENRLYPDEFENQVREELFIQKLDRFLAASLEPTDAELWLYYKRENEAVNLGFVAFNPSDYRKRVRVTRKELKTFYESNLEKYRYAPRRVVKFVLFPWKRYTEGIKLTDKDIRKYYEDNYSRYNEAFMSVKEKVRADVLKERALKKAFEEATRARTMIEEGKDFNEVVNALGLELKYTVPFQIPPAEDIPGIEDDASFAEKFKDLKEGEVAPVFRLGDAYYLSAVDHILPEETAPFENVINRVKEDYIITRSKELAENSARKFIEYARAKGLKRALRRFRLKPSETGEFDVNAFSIPGIGISTEIFSAAFISQDKGKPLQKPFYAGGTYYVVWIKERKRANRLDFEKNKEEYRSKLLQFKLNMARMTLLYQLRQRGKYTIYSDVLEKIS